MITNFLLLASFFGFCTMPLANVTQAQPVTRAVYGHVFEIGTEQPLIGATIIVKESEPLIGASTDVDGHFTLNRVPIGRQTLVVSYLGYETAVVSEVLVTTGKDIHLRIGLREIAAEMGGVTVVAGNRKDLPMNSMAVNSARSFTVEETRRYAGGMDDPARLVSAFAGVTVGNVQDNAIVVRGNSPQGVSWRLEGVEIPTPHHFSGGNVAGGGIVTLFSSQLMSNSDFFTSAFPAEYGNATAGVFDMKMRNGNFNRREHTLQFGVLGLDVASEGPIAEGSDASYLFNYRYSTFGLLTDLNIINTEQLFKYQDLSYKVNLPTRGAGVFSFWGIGGIDHSTQPAIMEPSAWITDWDRVTYNWDINLGATGISHSLIAGRNTLIQSTLAATGVDYRMHTWRLDDDLELRPDMLITDRNGDVSLGVNVHHRFSSKVGSRTGLTYRHLTYRFDIGSTIDTPDSFRNVTDERGSSSAVNAYTQYQWQAGSRLRLNGGVHAMYLGITRNLAVDPRLGLNWAVASGHEISLAYGLHSRMEELKVYFVKDGDHPDNPVPNRKLDFTRAHHVVLGYDWRISERYRLKAETYYQHLFDVPGETSGSFSMINYKQEWAFDRLLVNNGVGVNAGVDVTLERFLSNNYYWLLTGSVFDSRYRAADGVWRNTRYNKGFVVNALAGREFFFDQNRKVLGINGRVNYVGGERVSPVLQEESHRQKKEVFDETKAFSRQLPSMMYVDFTVTYRINYTRFSGIWALQVKNLLGTPIYEGYNYHIQSETVKLDKNVAVIPALSYKIEF